MTVGSANSSRTDGVRLGPTSQRLKTCSLRRQSITIVRPVILNKPAHPSPPPHPCPCNSTEPQRPHRQMCFSANLTSVFTRREEWSSISLHRMGVTFRPHSPFCSSLSLTLSLFFCLVYPHPYPHLPGPLSCSEALVITISLRMTVSGAKAPFHLEPCGRRACQTRCMNGNYLSMPAIHYFVLSRQTAVMKSGRELGKNVSWI